MEYTRRRFLGVSSAAVATLAGCTGGASSGPPEVSLLASSFDPLVVEVEPGDDVVFTVESGSHSVTLFHEDNDVEQRSPASADAFDETHESGELTHTFDTEGVHGIFCRPHRNVGMAMSVVVGEYSEDEPGLAPPQESLPSSMQSTIESINTEIIEGTGNGGGGGY